MKYKVGDWLISTYDKRYKLYIYDKSGEHYFYDLYFEGKFTTRTSFAFADIDDDCVLLTPLEQVL